MEERRAEAGGGSPQNRVMEKYNTVLHTHHYSPEKIVATIDKDLQMEG
jgi:hypothetical protein